MFETPIKTKIGEADLMVKIISPCDGAIELLRTIRNCFEYGNHEVWVMYSRQQELHQHIRGEKGIYIFTAEDIFTSTLFPGLSIKVADLFLISEGD